MNEPLLCVKELADALGRSRGYVYRAVACGLPVRWDRSAHCYVIAEDRARLWLERHRFSVVRGAGRVGL